MRTHNQEAAGYVFLLAMAIIPAFVTITSVGLIRSVNELVTGQRVVTAMQAFHIAEAGFDIALCEMNGAGTFSGTSCGGMWSSASAADDAACIAPVNCSKTTVSAGSAAANVVVIDFTGNMPQVKTTGFAAGTEERLRAIFQRSASAFDYAMTATTINMNGNAAFGDSLTRVNKVYAAGPAVSTGSFATSGSNSVWANKIEFSNPTNLPLNTLCPNCANGSIFHQPISFNEDAPPLPAVQLDLRPYYLQSLQSGNYHITANTTFPSGIYEGVMYVECGFDVTFNGTVTWNGTIVHEGCSKGLVMTGSGASLTINSSGGTSPFAPGLAVIGAPTVVFANKMGGAKTINIQGFLMEYGPQSDLSANGVIAGGVIGADAPYVNNNYPDLVSQDGPGSSPLITIPYARVDLGGGTIYFQAPSSGVPGITTGGAYKMLFWKRE